jgi:hypothetical protein
MQTNADAPSPSSLAKMNLPAELPAAYDDVLRKIGRNLLIFQQAEFLVKKLHFIGSYSVHFEESAESIEKRISICEKMTLGQVTNLLMGRHIEIETQSAESSSVAGQDPKSGTSWFPFHFTLGGMDGYPEARRQALTTMVAERNELVHHFHENFDRNSFESCLQASFRLDEQRRRILPEIHQLQEDLKAVTACLKEVLNLLDSPLGMEQLFLPEIQQCPLITNLAAIAAENPNPEDWIPVGPAIKRLQDFPREKISELVSQFGLKSLTHLLEASQQFDIHVEKVGKTSHRVLYRLKAASTPADCSFGSGVSGIE